MPFVVAEADHDTTALWLPLVAVGWAGVEGTPAGVTGLEAGEAALVPFVLVAVTVKVYGVPFVSVLTVQVSRPEDQVQVFDPGDEVTVYLVMGVPFVAGFVQVTVALFVPRVADGLAGAVGTCFVGFTDDLDVDDVALVPTPL